MEIKKIKTKDGTIMHYTNIEGINKLHNWDGPALIPQGNNKLSEYYVYGIKYSKDKWDQAKKDQVGLPFYKSSMKLDEGNRF